MKCNKCDTENSDESVFCNKCGAKLLSNNEKEEKRLIKIKDRLKLFRIKDRLKIFNNKKNNIIMGSALIILIFIVSIIFYVNNPVSKFKSAIADNNQAEATTLYNEKIKGNSDKEKKINMYLKDEVSKIENSFIEDKVDYDKAKKILETIKNTGLISSEVNTTIDKINRVNDSRSAFKKAEEFIKESDYVNAIKEYKNVIQDDKNYEKAKKQIQDNKDKYKEQVLKDAEESANSNDYDKAVSLIKESTSIIENDSDLNAKLAVYNKKLDDKKAEERKEKIDQLKGKQEIEVISSSIVPDYFKLNDEAEIIVKNNTNKVVKKYTVGILMYDSNGYPLKSGTLAGGNELFQGKADSVNIQPGQSSGQNYVWNLYTNYGTINKIIACPINVEYYDGSKWTNDYYQYWKEDYLGKQYK